MQSPIRIRNSHIFCGLAALLVTSITSASAATIDWGSGALNVTADTEISDQGSLVRALKFGEATNRTINGVTFTGYTTNTNSNTGTFNVASGADVSGNWGGNNFTGYNPGTETRTISTEYSTALNTGQYTNGLLGTHTQTLSGLAVGQQYLIQVWFNDTRNVTNPQRVQFDSGASTPTVLLSSDNSPRFGQYAIGTFTADATGQQILRFTETANQGGATINMFQIRAIPEPSIALLGGLGVLTLLRRRRN